MLTRKACLNLALILTVAALPILAAACASRVQIQPGGGHTFTVKGKTYQQVWMASVAAVTKNLNIQHMDKKRGELTGIKPLWGRGEAVAIFIRPAADKGKRHTIEVKSTVADDPLTDWPVFMASEIKDAL